MKIKNKNITPIWKLKYNRHLKSKKCQYYIDIPTH